ncbi:IS3 family transposase [Oceanobacillus jeddahense]|uniref:IS3 family transposase n=1 Tax=Oceanobacillus jeddahense TaxID=1462527 RepID=UPI003B84677A
MSKRLTKHELDERIQIVRQVLDKRKTIGATAKKNGVDERTLKSWIRKYQDDGADGLKESRSWKFYSAELKQQAVEFYLYKGGSLESTCNQFHISSRSVLQRWINHYTSGKEMKSTNKGSVKMSERRKTTFKERIEIVQYAIANDLNYQQAAEKYGVSYQQVYSWVRKYRKDGEQALQDRRGKTLESKPNLTEEEKLQLRIKELEHRTQYLEAENGLLKKLEGNRKERMEQVGKQVPAFEAIHAYHEEIGTSIQLLCDILKVSRSGYYKWLNHTPGNHEEENAWLMKQIQAIFKQYGGIYGYRRIRMVIQRKYGKRYNLKRIRRLMILLSLKSFIRRSSGYSTKTSYVNIEDNILNREFTADKPNQKWVIDITHLKYRDGHKAYLCVIKDLYDGSIVAYKAGYYNDNDLVMETIKAALEANPGATPLLHSDRGAQFTSKEYRFVTTEAGITRSMSRVGNCIDNAPVESFFGHFKSESYDFKQYQSFEGLAADIDWYIRFYNEKRYQENLNSLAPLEYRYQAVA